MLDWLIKYMLVRHNRCGNRSRPLSFRFDGHSTVGWLGSFELSLAEAQ
jgi:hypothetical protein